MTFREYCEIEELLKKDRPKPWYQIKLHQLKSLYYKKGLIGMWIKEKPIISEEEEEVNKFYKVRIEQFLHDFLNQFPNEGIGNTAYVEELYENIKLPKRSTSGSAGYDFFAPFDLEFAPKSSLTIPTGIKCQIDNRWFLSIYARSGLGFKYGLRPMNILPVIDSDYYNNDNNEGHIMVRLFNPSEKPVVIEQGKAFAQGIFLPYGLTVDDDADGVRDGGFGSTDAK